MLQELMKTKTARGTGYYYYVHESSTTYICWRDVRVVTMITTAYPGHYEHYVTRKVRNVSGQMKKVDIPLYHTQPTSVYPPNVCLYKNAQLQLIVTVSTFHSYTWFHSTAS